MGNLYVAPGRGKKSFTCPHCHTLSLMTWATHYYNEDTSNVVTKDGIIKEYSNQLSIARCVSCGKKIIWVNNTYVYPDIVAEEPNADMPESVKQLYNEAGLIYNKSPRLLAHYCVWR